MTTKKEVVRIQIYLFKGKKQLMTSGETVRGMYMYALENCKEYYIGINLVIYLSKHIVRADNQLMVIKG